MTTISMTAKAESAAPKVRIVEAIDEHNLVTLKGNTHPAATAKNDQGKVSDSLPMTDLILVLNRDPAQQAAFEKFVASQYDSNSPSYHQWLTPQQVGENFGPSQTDIATISNWLTGHGFNVTQVTPDRMSIRFDGNAAQVQSTFHTEIHNLLVKGVQHIGNMSDPQIPAALSPVVVGVKALHNFFPRPLHRMGSAVQRDAKTGGWNRIPTPSVAGTGSGTAGVSAVPARGAKTALRATPKFGITGSEDGQPYQVEDVGPYDFATIYDILPLWTQNSPIDGSNQTIAIAGTSAINSPVPSGTTLVNNNGQNDVATFRNFFGLPTNNAANTPIQMSGNGQPLTVCIDETGTLPCGIDDLIENSLDVEWSASVAKNAQIILVSSYPSSATDDNLYDSESYIVSHVTAHIMNVSYGECELALGTAGNVQYYDMWQTAASEGISVFVAAGDSGSASCDDGGDDLYGNPYTAQYGTTVSGLASTPWNTAVGGTDFNWCPLLTAVQAGSSSSSNVCSPGPYWSSTNKAAPGSTNASYNALGYVPEVPWNDTCTSPLALPYMEYYWTGSGLTVPTDAESGCNAFVNNYEFLVESYEEGNSDLGVETLVDTVGGSGGASGCIVNSTSSAITNDTLGSCTAGQTSTGSTSNPDTGAAQGSLTVVNNGWPKPAWQAGVSGIPNDQVRDIPDVSFFASDGFLSSSAYLICVSEITPCSYSSKSEPIAEEVGGTSVATPAMAGVMALVLQKTGEAQGLATPELYKLAATQTYSDCSAERGNGQPATAGSCLFNDIDTGTNAMACDNGAPEGGTEYNGEFGEYVPTEQYAGVVSPNCNVIHAGDTVGIASGYSATAGFDLASGLGSLNVANVVNAWTAVVGTAGATVSVSPAQNSIPSSQSLSVTVTVASTASGGPTPTGTVTLTSGSYSSGAQTLNSSGSFTFTIPGGTLAVGTDSLKATYSGDSNYAGTSNSAQVTVTGAALLTATVNVNPASATLNSNASLSVPVTVTGSGATPSGTVTLTSGSYSSGAQTLASGAFTFTIPANTLAGGSDVLTVTYSGDANYGTSTGTATVTVTEATFSLTTPAIAVSPTSIAPGGAATAVVTVASTAGYSGTVTLTCQETDPSPNTGDGASCFTGGTGSVNLTGTGSSGTVSFTIGTTAPGGVASLAYPNVHGKGKGSPSGWAGAGSGALLALLVFLGIPARRRSWRAMVGMLVLFAALGGMTACGGGSTTTGGGGSDPGTAAGTYTFLIQATGTPAVTPAVSTTFTVVVN
jgi:trimeric autotransporter adhesin